MRRPPRSTLFPYTNALPILDAAADGNPQRSRARFGGLLDPATDVSRAGRAAALLALRADVVEAALSPANATGPAERDRKSTRLNSSHTVISYAVFCLKKKTK